MLSVLKNICCLLVLLLLLNGCITIRSLNVNSYDANPETKSVPIYDASHVGGTSASNEVMTPISEMGNPDLPAPSLSSASSSYVIQARDELEIKFYYNEKLNETVAVRPDGCISLQLVQDVQAASLTTNELASVLRKKYGSYLVNPEISVIVRSFDIQKIFVDGQVGKPGMYKMGQYMTIMQAIASAGGLMNTAHGDDVLVIRRNFLNKPFIITVDLNSARDGTDVGQDIALKPYDIVYVPKSTIANINTWVDQYIRRNIPINVGYDLNNVIEVKN